MPFLPNVSLSMDQEIVRSSVEVERGSGQSMVATNGGISCTITRASNLIS